VIGCFRAGIVAAALGSGNAGLALGASAAVVAAIAARARLSPAHDGPDRVLVAAGLWLGVVAAATELLADGTLRSGALAVALLGIGFAGAGLSRLRGRNAWLDDVRRGRVPGWEIVARAHSAEDLDVPCLVELADPRPEVGILRRRAPESPRSYREAPPRAQALVRLRPGPSAFDLWRSRVESSMLADPLAACLAALLKGVLVSLLVLAATVSITTVLLWCLCSPYWG